MSVDPPVLGRIFAIYSVRATLSILENCVRVKQDTIQPALQDIQEYIASNAVTTLTGLGSKALQIYVATKLMHTPLAGISAVLWLVENTIEQKKVLELLRYWHTQLTNAYVPISFEPDSTTWLLSMLNNLRVILVATPENAKKVYDAQIALPFTTLTITPSTELSLYKLKRMLLEAGFFENTYADQPGTLAIRGDVFDVWPEGFAHAIRIVFDATTVAEMYTFSNNQKKLHNLTQLHIPIRSKETSLQPPLPDLIITEYQHKVLLPQTLSESKQCVIQSHASAQFDCGGTILPPRLTQQDIATYLKPGSTKYILTTSKHSLSLAQNQESHIVPSFVYHDNWHCALLKTTFFVTDHGKQRTTSKRKQLLAINKLAPGDFVVHQDHGVARFAGMIQQTIDDIKTEYILLQYHGGDKLYVPPYQVNKLTKYIGEAHPKINKLSGTSWMATVAKIRQETLQLAHEIISLTAKRQLQTTKPITEHPSEQKLAAAFPYELTPDQQTAWEAITHDLASGKLMDRLICGDVAFGKTELALRAAFRIVQAGGQVALLAPTTILVQQHFDLFKKRLGPLGVRVTLLSRWTDTKQQREAIDGLTNGDVQIVIGTHRLLSSDVIIPNLELLLIDEEQKFGVKDKEKLRRKRPLLHTLTLSATPIPRTLNYSLSGIRDISLIQTPPPGRLPVTTTITPYEIPVIKKTIQAELTRGGQIYYLLAKVREIPAAQNLVEKLAPKARIAIAHGQLPPKQLAQTMANFDNGKIDILICSTIIENGLDVPNANTLIVDNAAHFGLSQLYQLRGRIGRGTQKGNALFLFKRQKLTGVAAKRLEALQAAYTLGSGFDIALRDLEIRGAGNLLGKEQHGEITAIGLSLYTQLLEQEIEQLEHPDTITKLTDVTIDLPIQTTLSTITIQNDARRLAVYQELALLSQEATLVDEARKLFAEPWPDDVHNMVELLRIKLLSQQASIYAIDSHVRSKEPFAAKITLHLTPEHNATLVAKLLEYNDEWLYDGSTLKINTQNLGEPWIEGLRKNITKLVS